MQAISRRHNCFIFNFPLKPYSFGQGRKFQKFECLKKQKSILGEIKRIFHNFQRLLMVKYKIIADTGYKNEERFRDMLSFLIYSFAAPWTTMDHYWGYCVSYPMLITRFIQVSIQRSLGPCNLIVSLNLADCLVGFEPETFLFLCNTFICCATLPKLRFSR